MLSVPLCDGSEFEVDAGCVVVESRNLEGGILINFLRNKILRMDGAESVYKMDGFD